MPESPIPSNSKILSGPPVFRGTRVPVQHLFDCREGRERAWPTSGRWYPPCGERSRRCSRARSRSLAPDRRSLASGAPLSVNRSGCGGAPAAGMLHGSWPLSHSVISSESSRS